MDGYHFFLANYIAVKGLRYKLVTRDVDPDRPINSGITAHRATNQMYNLSADPNEQDNLLHEGKPVTSGQGRLSVDVIYSHLSSSLKVHIESTRIGVAIRPQPIKELESKSGVHELKNEITSRITAENSFYSSDVKQEDTESEQARRNSRGDWLKLD